MSTYVNFSASRTYAQMKAATVNATAHTVSVGGTTYPKGTLFIAQDADALYIFDGQRMRALSEGDLRTNELLRNIGALTEQTYRHLSNKTIDAHLNNAILATYTPTATGTQDIMYSGSTGDVSAMRLYDNSSTSGSQLTWAKTYNFTSTAAKTFLILADEAIEGVPYNLFRGAAALTAIKLPYGLKRTGVDILNSCTRLLAIDLPPTLEEIGNEAFCNTGLTAVTFPATLRTIGSKAFMWCRGLTSVTLPAGLTSLGAQAFANCSALTDAYVPTGLTVPDDAFPATTTIHRT